MNFPAHHGPECVENQAMTLQGALAGELRGNDPHAVVSAAAPGTRVAGVGRRFVDDVQLLRIEGSEPLAHCPDDFRHGNTLRKGRAVVRANTPSVT